MNFFFYGTLIHPSVFKLVTGELQKEVRKATLFNFKAFYLKSFDYPGLKRCEGARQDGIVVEGNHKIQNRLLLFEDEYLLKDFSVVLEDGRDISAKLFFQNELEDLSSKEWSYDDWLKGDLEGYLKKTKGYMDERLAGKIGSW